MASHTQSILPKIAYPLLSWAQKTAPAVPRSAPAMKWFLSLLVLVPTSCLKFLDPQGLGLPVASKRPGWLARCDELVVDARPKQRGGMLILQLVLNDAYGYWGSEGSTARPRWLRAILATNRKHAMQHGHAMVLRWKRTLPLTEWQEEMCSQKGQSREECAKSWERENFCWEKFPFMVPWNAAKSWRLCSANTPKLQEHMKSKWRQPEGFGTLRSLSFTEVGLRLCVGEHGECSPRRRQESPGGLLVELAGVHSHDHAGCRCCLDQTPGTDVGHRYI